MRYLVAIFVLLRLLAPIHAQESEAIRVELNAEAGITLVGDWYAPQNAPAEGAPAILLLHMYGDVRTAYAPVIPILHEAGYGVLNVDLRGFGESSKPENWRAAQTDVQLWLDWLREQDDVRDDALATLGASIGANLALVGCANDAGCVTAIALSPGLDYEDIRPEEFVKEGLRDRSVLLVAAHLDTTSSAAVRRMGGAARNNVLVRLYTGRVHGTNMFRDHLDHLSRLILLWLDEQFAVEN